MIELFVNVAILIDGLLALPQLDCGMLHCAATGAKRVVSLEPANVMEVNPLYAVASVINTMDRMNRVDKFSIELVETPDRHPDCMDSGETAAWIEARKKHLAMFGYRAEWDAGARTYWLRQSKR